MLTEPLNTLPIQPSFIVRKKAHYGLLEIRHLLQSNNENYNAHYTVLNTSGVGNRAEVFASVSGTFADSPAQLVFDFTVEDYKITILECKTC